MSLKSKRSSSTWCGIQTLRFKATSDQNSKKLLPSAKSEVEHRAHQNRWTERVSYSLKEEGQHHSQVETGVEFRPVELPHGVIGWGVKKHPTDIIEQVSDHSQGESKTTHWDDWSDDQRHLWPGRKSAREHAHTLCQDGKSKYWVKQAIVRQEEGICLESDQKFISLYESRAAHIRQPVSR